MGSGGAILHYDGTTWSIVSGGTTPALFGVWGSFASEVWAVGGLGGLGDPRIFRYDGTSWSPGEYAVVRWRVRDLGPRLV